MKPSPLLFAFALGFTLTSFGALAWTNPSGIPPNNNTATPIHTGSASQTRNGDLGLGGLTVFGDARLEASQYVNWGTIREESGYGLRSNGGIMEYKNAGDPAWTPFPVLGFGQTQQFSFAVAATWDICATTAFSMSCEVLGTANNAKTNQGWVEEEMTSGVKFLTKEMPGQSSTAWKICQLGGYTTPYDHGSLAYILKKPDNKWYVYIGLDFYTVNYLNITATCSR